MVNKEDGAVRRACGDSDRSVSRGSGKRVLSNEVAGGEERNRILLAVGLNDGDSYPPALEIENGISRVTLGKQGAFWIAVNYCSARPGIAHKRTL